ncbi:C-type lectin domain family 4 member A-like isoform X1 [Tupaia chinensis]|uniref:C-type lectin domain family 4 member A-like isoform X1 n=1 Tax=Tupaia chinensis TaxID=246437 RepID=UPI00070435FE|nr:C-type lectin domain family 4 member A-like isoform X1 [Tupaia chinensis]
MASDIIYGNVRFRNESMCSGTNSVSPSVSMEETIPHKSYCGLSNKVSASLLILLLLLAKSFFIAVIILVQKSQCLKEKSTREDLIHTKLECAKINLTTEGKAWSCCPKDWKSFDSSCYLASTETKSWSKSKENCSGMGAHLLVINSKAEQEFIIKTLDVGSIYYVGLSDPEGQRRWQWVDQTPYSENISFWHPGEANNPTERCVVVHFHSTFQQWGWSDISCEMLRKSVCERKEIYL